MSLTKPVESNEIKIDNKKNQEFYKKVSEIRNGITMLFTEYFYLKIFALLIFLTVGSFLLGLLMKNRSEEKCNDKGDNFKLIDKNIINKNCISKRKKSSLEDCENKQANSEIVIRVESKNFSSFLNELTNELKF